MDVLQLMISKAKAAQAELAAEAKVTHARKLKCATRIQALFRGFLIRRKPFWQRGRKAAKGSDRGKPASSKAVVHKPRVVVKDSVGVLDFDSDTGSTASCEDSREDGHGALPWYEDSMPMSFTDPVYTPRSPETVVNSVATPRTTVYQVVPQVLAHGHVLQVPFGFGLVHPSAGNRRPPSTLNNGSGR